MDVGSMTDVGIDSAEDSGEDSGYLDAGIEDAGEDAGTADSGPSIPVNMPRAPFDTTLDAVTTTCGAAPVIDSSMGSTLIELAHESTGSEVLCSEEPSSRVTATRRYRLRLLPGQSATYQTYLSFIGVKERCGDSGCVDPLSYRDAIRNDDAAVADVNLALGYIASSPTMFDGQVAFRFGDASSSDCSAAVPLPMDAHVFAQAPGALGTPTECGIARPAYYAVTVPSGRTLVVWVDNEQSGNTVKVVLREGCAGVCVPLPPDALPFDNRAFYTNTTGSPVEIRVLAGTRVSGVGRYFRLYASLY